MDERKIRARLEAERERLLSVRRHLLGDPRRRRISRGGASREHRLTPPDGRLGALGRFLVVESGHPGGCHPTALNGGD
jgi:hypothetical protein